MWIFASFATVSIAFLAVSWWLFRRLGGGAGPVIIITPPPEMLNDKNLPKVLGWRLKARPDDADTPIDFREKLNEKLPAHVFETIGEVAVAVKSGSTPVGFQKLTLKLKNKADVIISTKEDGRLGWETHLGKSWRSSGGKLDQWPKILIHEVTDIELLDAEDNKYTSSVISEITIKLLQ